jgi:pseudouridine-5'-phosphate glycosidase
LKTNIELVKNNAKLCTKIAVAFFKHWEIKIPSSLV